MLAVRCVRSLSGAVLLLLLGLSVEAQEPAPLSAAVATDEAPAPHEPLTPLAELLLQDGSTLRVADAIAQLGQVEPPASPAIRPDEDMPSGEAVPVAAAVPDYSPLSRPITLLTLEGAADPRITSQMSNLSADFAIRDLALEHFGDWNAPDYDASSAPARFGGRVATWAAPALYSRPLYFEQPNLERYGHYVALCERDNLTQSALSAAHFFATVPVLPYKMGAQSPDECSYVLGHYRPGSCNPHQLQRPELSLRGLAYQGLTVTGLVFLIP